jgi:HTH-type transcriptional regulator/antitoxin HigA
MTLTFDKTQYNQLLFQYQPKIIKTEAENEKALTIVERLMYQKNRSLEEDALYDLLIVLVEKFEREFYEPGLLSTPESMLEFLMEQQQMTAINLAPILGSVTIVNEVITGDREMTITQVKQLATKFGVEPSVFI